MSNAQPVYKVIPPDPDLAIIRTTDWAEAVIEARFYQVSTIQEWLDGRHTADLDLPRDDDDTQRSMQIDPLILAQRRIEGQIAEIRCEHCGNNHEDFAAPAHAFHGEMICDTCYQYEQWAAEEDRKNGIITIWFHDD